ncbi:MAG: hypothetical protein LJE94_12375 [Deltaproteobacteria bacterium]|nr:hypothetical protein [Deltaproteobacteria bacterium]
MKLKKTATQKQKPCRNHLYKEKGLCSEVSPPLMKADRDPVAQILLDILGKWGTETEEKRLKSGAAAVYGLREQPESE